ncbi:hypothetical protein FQR65_LT02022 [Abscondita terminalis]|nr:hypothetical protein FQR65_LT02022 [Abscondita terminalis]
MYDQLFESNTTIATLRDSIKALETENAELRRLYEMKSQSDDTTIITHVNDEESLSVSLNEIVMNETITDATEIRTSVNVGDSSNSIKALEIENAELRLLYEMKSQSDDTTIITHVNDEESLSAPLNEIVTTVDVHAEANGSPHQTFNDLRGKMSLNNVNSVKRRIVILTDDNGRYLSEAVSDNKRFSGYSVESTYKPGATSQQILNDDFVRNNNLTADDCLLLFTGHNDVHQVELSCHLDFSHLENFIKNNHKCFLFCASVPLVKNVRVNKYISLYNQKLKQKIEKLREINPLTYFIDTNKALCKKKIYICRYFAHEISKVLPSISAVSRAPSCPYKSNAPIVNNNNDNSVSQDINFLVDDIVKVLFKHLKEKFKELNLT